MNILVINGSPYKEKSTTLKLTKAFLEGIGQSAEIINTIDLRINNCSGCYACWMHTNGHCVQQDDAALVLEKIRNVDLVIWSIPLFCYSVPASCKALMDRTLCFNKPEMYVGEDNRAHHYGYEDGSKKAVLISSGGLPDVEGNFDGLIFQLRHMYGLATPAICCAEAALILNPATQELANNYLAVVRQAGAEYAKIGTIQEETQKQLDTPMLPREMYITNTNQMFEQIKNNRMAQK